MPWEISDGSFNSSDYSPFFGRRDLRQKIHDWYANKDPTPREPRKSGFYSGFTNVLREENNKLLRLGNDRNYRDRVQELQGRFRSKAESIERDNQYGTQQLLEQEYERLETEFRAAVTKFQQEEQRKDPEYREKLFARIIENLKTMPLYPVPETESTTDQEGVYETEEELGVESQIPTTEYKHHDWLGEMAKDISQAKNRALAVEK